MVGLVNVCNECNSSALTILTQRCKKLTWRYLVAQIRCSVSRFFFFPLFLFFQVAPLCVGRAGACVVAVKLWAQTVGGELCSAATQQAPLCYTYQHHTKKFREVFKVILSNWITFSPFRWLCVICEATVRSGLSLPSVWFVIKFSCLNRSSATEVNCL